MPRFLLFAGLSGYLAYLAILAGSRAADYSLEQTGYTVAFVFCLMLALGAFGTFCDTLYEKGLDAGRHEGRD